MSEPFEEPTTAEADPGDAAEQRAPAVADPDAPATPDGVPLEVPEADAVEQSAEVPDDEEDYPA